MMNVLLAFLLAFSPMCFAAEKGKGREQKTYAQGPKKKQAAVQTQQRQQSPAAKHNIPSQASSAASSKTEEQPKQPEVKKQKMAIVVVRTSTSLQDVSSVASSSEIDQAKASSIQAQQQTAQVSPEKPTPSQEEPQSKAVQESVDSKGGSSSQSQQPEPAQDRASSEQPAVVQAKENVSTMVPKSDYPIHFFEQKTSELVHQAQDRLGYLMGLAQGADVDKKDKQFIETFTRDINKMRPQCVLQGISTKRVDKAPGRILDTVLKDVVSYETSDPLIKRIKAWLDDTQTALCLKIWRKEGTAYQAQETMINLDKKGLSIAINALLKLIYVGCQDHNIRVFDVQEKKCSKIMKGHTGPVSAVALAWDGKCLISRTDAKETFVWSIGDSRPRIALENIDYSKDYIFNKSIVRSHVDKSLISSIWDNDRIYDIPFSYLQNQVMLNGGQAACLYLVYHLMQLPKEAVTVQVNSIIAAVKNSPYLNNFDLPVQDALIRFLRIKAEERVNTVEKSTLALTK